MNKQRSLFSSFIFISHMQMRLPRPLSVNIQNYYSISLWLVDGIHQTAIFSA